MKILLVGDPHFKASSLALMRRASGEILSLIEEVSPDLCVVMGDTLDTHERINIFAHVHAVTWFKAIAEKVPLVVLIGNHDRENNQVFLTPVHPFTGIESERIRVVDRVVWDKEKKMIFVPYVPPGRFLEALSTVDYSPEGEEQPRFIFAHQEFSGSKMGVKLSTKGDKWTDRLPHVFSGHIHEYQELPGVTYVGTFHQQNFGETDDKALMLLTVEENSWTAERIRLTSIRPKTTLRLTMEQLREEVAIPEGSDVRVIIHLDETEIPGLNSSPQFLSLKSRAEKVELKVKRTTRVDKMNLVAVSLEEITKKMLEDDSFTLSLLLTEVL